MDMDTGTDMIPILAMDTASDMDTGIAAMATLAA
jgi:hypothetical protein